MLTEVMKGTVTPVIVLGDLNDGQHSNTINILSEQPRYLVGDSRGGGDIALYTAQTLQEYRDTRDVWTPSDGEQASEWLFVPGTYRGFDFAEMANASVEPGVCSVVDITAWAGDAGAVRRPRSASRETRPAPLNTR